MSNEIHTGNLLRNYFTVKRIAQSAAARNIGITAKTLATYFKRKTMRIDTMLHLSHALNYNFLKEIANSLPNEMPPHNTNPLQTRVTELEQQNHDLAMQVKTLEKALELVGRK